MAQAEALMSTGKTTYKGLTLPEGFAPTKIAGEDSIDDGLVITDGNGNEYVWVEVPKTTEVYKITGLNITDFDNNYENIEKDLHNSLYVIKKRNKVAIFSCVMSIIKTPHLLPSIIFKSHIISQIKSFIHKSQIIVASHQIIFPTMNRGEVHSKLSFLTTINIFRRLLYYHRIYLMY